MIMGIHAHLTMMKLEHILDNVGTETENETYLNLKMGSK